MTVVRLRDIRSVKTRVSVPVTYADVWEFWLRYREISEEVDFITVHMLPYWEDIPPAPKMRPRMWMPSGSRWPWPFPARKS